MTKNQKEKVKIMGDRFYEAQGFDAYEALDKLESIISGMFLTNDKRLSEVQAVYSYIQRVYC